ncbi:MAG: hypothetical protein JXA25_17145 [Anaerolineales bacterium]|nr:hypothetical protein [Anaerolineales bacterium]
MKLQQTTPFSFLEKVDSARSPLKAPPDGITRSEYRRRFGEKNAAVTTDCRALPIYHSALPGGRRAPLLKAMITTTCERRCHYCAFHPSTNIPRIQFTADEMASIFMQLFESGRVHGLFLSSGITNGGANAQNIILDTAHILRHRYAFRGYLHLKIMPGAEIGQVLQAMRLADRVSVNLEAPSAHRLKILAPKKQFGEELLQPLQWIEQLRLSQIPETSFHNRWPSSSTQFVVGASGESDLEILQASQHLFTHLKLARIYYQAFSPQPGTPFENLPPEQPSREHHLYQASILLKQYNFDVEELPFDASGNLPETSDPKLALARNTLAEDPVEINHAPLEHLLRIPGIGPTGAMSILKARKTGALNDLSQLTRLGIFAERAAPFILLDGQRPSYQMKLL